MPPTEPVQGDIKPVEKPKTKAKRKNKGPKVGVKIDSPLLKLMKAMLKDYEAKCIEFGTSPCSTIKEALKLGIDEEKLILSFVVDPKDRMKVEYWNDEKFVTYFENGGENYVPSKKKKKKKAAKPEKPLVRLLPFIDTLRNKRYLKIKELYVWDVLIDHSDMMCLGSMLEKGIYDLEYIELVDCFINEKCIDAFAPSVNFTKTLSDLILDFNEFGDRGCNILCTGLQNCGWLIRLSICFCDLHKQSGIWLGNLVAETSIRELFLDGNQLEAEGAIALLTQLSEAAITEGFEKEQAARLKLEQIEEAKNAKINRYNLEGEINQSAFVQDSESDVDVPDTNANAKKKAVKGGGKKGKKKMKKPPSGPQISHLHLAENGINHLGRGGNFAPVRCMQLLKEIISKSKDLKEIDIFGNEIGDVGGRILLEGVLARKDSKLPRIGLRVTHLINQDTFDMINKLAPGPKIKKKKKGLRR